MRAVAPHQRQRIPGFDETVPLYAVDDAQALLVFEQEELFNLMNEVRSHPGYRIVVAGHAPIHQLPLREDIKSRLSWGLVFELHYLDSESALGEFRHLASERGIDLDEGVCRWIAVHCLRDMRSLRQFLDDIDAYAMEKKRRVTLPLLLQWASERKDESGCF